MILSLLISQESNGPSDAYAAISNADRLQAEPESLRKWREEQKERLEMLGDCLFFLQGLASEGYFVQCLGLCGTSLPHQSQNQSLKPAVSLLFRRQLA